QEGEISTPSLGGADIFLARYAADGSLSWVATAGGESREEGHSVAVDSTRNAAVIGGVFVGTATFGQGQSHETTLVAGGGWEDADLFVARYDVDGQLAWAKRSGSRKPEITTAVAVDPRDGSVVVAGVYVDSMVFGAGEENSVAIGKGLIFVAKYASDGAVIWARGVAGVDPEDTSISGNVQNLAVNGTDGSIVVVGGFSKGLVFGAGEPNETVVTAIGENDAYPADNYVAKYRADGTLAWAKDVDSNANDLPSGLDVNAADGSILLAGRLWETITFDPGEPTQVSLTAEAEINGYLAKLTAEGTVIWARRDGGPYNVGTTDVKVDPRDGSVIACGVFTGQAILGAGQPNVTLLSNPCSYDC
ncbi:MAG: hypothetical protein HYZ36_03935, partial [Pedosphaera parvula]|nr:hypothetical protein [Pedosphaera parvula]